jgi:hypothetical protein
MPRNAETPRNSAGAVIATDADSGAGGNLLVAEGCVSFDPQQVTLAQVGAIEGLVNRQGLTEFARSAGQIAIRTARSVATHGIYPLQRFKCPDEYRRRGALWFGDDVEAMVHAIDQVDVSMTRWAIHGRIPAGGARPGVTGQIRLIEVGFSFHDAPRQALAIQYAHDSLTQELSRHGQRRAGVKFAGQPLHASASHSGQKDEQLVGVFHLSL